MLFLQIQIFRVRSFNVRQCPCSAQRIIMKLTSPIKLFCPNLGSWVIFYQDVSIIMGGLWMDVIQHGVFVLPLLNDLEFSISLENSYVSLAQEFTFLGLCWNTREASVTLTEEKWSRYCTSAHLMPSQS